MRFPLKLTAQLYPKCPQEREVRQSTAETLKTAHRLSWTSEPREPAFKGLTTLMPTIDWPGFKSSLRSSSASTSSADATISASQKEILARSEISASSGFGNAAALRHHFRRRLGVTPTGYRTQFGEAR